MSHHILVVEDNVSTRELYVDILETYDYTVEVLLNGQEVVDYFETPDKTRPDLLLLDINLPEKNGVYVLKYLRGKLKLNTLKILVVTANHIAGQMPEMTLADHVMTKPFLPKQLRETIEEVMAAPPRELDEVTITGESVAVSDEPATEAETTNAIVDAETPVETSEEPTDTITETVEAETIDPHKADTVETKAVKAQKETRENPTVAPNEEKAS